MSNVNKHEKCLHRKFKVFNSLKNKVGFDTAPKMMPKG